MFLIEVRKRCFFRLDYRIEADENSTSSGVSGGLPNTKQPEITRRLAESRGFLRAFLLALSNNAEIRASQLGYFRRNLRLIKHQYQCRPAAAATRRGVLQGL